MSLIGGTEYVSDDDPGYSYMSLTGIDKFLHLDLRQSGGSLQIHLKCQTWLHETLKIFYRYVFGLFSGLRELIS
jgi:hypothetical protein